MAKHIEKSGKEQIAVADFTDQDGKFMLLGQFLAEEFSVALLNTNQDFEIVDRAYVQHILQDHKLSSIDLGDPQTVKHLGEIADIEVLITGTITSFGESVHLVVKTIDTETAEVIDANSGNILKTQAIEDLLKEERKTGEKSPPNPLPRSPFNRALILNVTASSILKPQVDAQGNRHTYEPQNIIDGDRDTAWVEGVSGHGKGEWVKVAFTHDVAIRSISIVGEYKGKKNSRLKTIEISFSDGSSQKAELEDSTNSQLIELGSVRTMNWVTFEIVDIYPGERFEDTPIAEVHFE